MELHQSELFRVKNLVILWDCTMTLNDNPFFMLPLPEKMRQNHKNNGNAKYQKKKKKYKLKFLEIAKKFGT
jgi:hypothetical protein